MCVSAERNKGWGGWSWLFILVNLFSLLIIQNLLHINITSSQLACTCEDFCGLIEDFLVFLGFALAEIAKWVGPTWSPFDFLSKF